MFTDVLSLNSLNLKLVNKHVSSELFYFEDSGYCSDVICFIIHHRKVKVGMFHPISVRSHSCLHPRTFISMFDQKLQLCLDQILV